MECYFVGWESSFHVRYKLSVKIYITYKQDLYCYDLLTECTE